MKLYLDDERITPNGWIRTKTAHDTIEFLKTEKVTDLSLDHDLGDESVVGTGYDVLIWLEQNIFEGTIKNVPNITVHSANISARSKMEAAILSIKYIANSKLLENWSVL